MTRSVEPAEAPDPRIRGRIPTLTEVVGPLDWSPALGDATGVAWPEGPPFLELGDEEARALDAERHLVGAGEGGEGSEGGDVEPAPADDAAASDDDAAWTEALLARMAPQIEQIIRDAMRDAQFAALARVRMLMKDAIQASRPKPGGPLDFDSDPEIRPPFKRPES